MIIDTDILIRYFTNDDPKKADLFRKFLLSGKTATLTDVTTAEVYFVLKSFYKQKEENILDILDSLITHPSIICNKTVLQMTLSLARTHKLGFVDAYVASSAIVENESTVLSYDMHFHKIPGLKRIEP